MGKSIYGRNGSYIAEYDNGTYYVNSQPVAYLQNGKIYKSGTSESIYQVFDDGRVYSGSDYIGQQEGDNFYIGAELVASMNDCKPGETAWFGQTDSYASSSNWLANLIEGTWMLVRYGWPFVLGSAALVGIGFGVYWLIGNVSFVLPIVDWLWIGLAFVGVVLCAVSLIPMRRRGVRFFTRSGMVALFLSFSIICLIKFGFVSCWAFPLDFLAAERCREGCLSALGQCPPALAIYRGFISFTSREGTIILNDGVKGLLDSASALIELSTEKLPFLLALISIPFLILGGLLSVVVALLVFPFICLTLPFVIPFIACRLLGRLLSAIRG